MSTQDDVDSAIDDLNDDIAEIVDDTRRWTQEQSAEIYEGIAAECRDRAQLIRKEMES